LTSSRRRFKVLVIDRQPVHSLPPSYFWFGVTAVEYLATWNFKHIANATLRTKINDVIRDNGYAPPIICTPEELAGMTDDPNNAD